MRLLEELQSKRLDAIQNHALKIAEDLEPLLFEAAEQGRNKIEMKISGRDDSYILATNEFRQGLRMMLEGCAVRYLCYTEKPLIGKPYIAKYLEVNW